MALVESLVVRCRSLRSERCRKNLPLFALRFFSMETKNIIDLISEVLSKDWTDWRPVVKAIETNNFDIDAPCKSDGWTLLQWALEHDHDQAASFVIARGASINAKGVGKFDCTPLDVAVRKGNDKYVDMFVRHGGTGATPAKSKRMELISRGKEALLSLVKDSKSSSFVQTVQHFENVFGVTAKSDRSTGFTCFPKVSLPDVLSLPGKRKDQISQLTSAFTSLSHTARKQGAMLYCDLWLGTSVKKCHVFLVPTVSDIQLISALTAVSKSPLAGNLKLFEPLVDFFEIHPYQFLSINKDAIVLSFVDEIANLDDLVANATRLFPFLREYHTAGAANPEDINVNELLADDVRDDNTIHIIYHSF